MPPVKKVKPISFQVVEEPKAILALQIQSYFEYKRKTPMVITDEQTRVNTEKVNDFEKTYHHSYLDTVIEIWKWYSYILPEKRDYSIEEIYKTYRNCISRADNEPMKLVKYEGQKYIGGYEWVFKGCIYEVKGFYSDDEIKLLILEDFDRERKCFEKLNVKFNQTVNSGATYERSRIPENIRIEVWRRDGGKCARCGSREKLEYDHIVPISKGGSNTARNIELLCEKCNRSKSNNVV